MLGSRTVKIGALLFVAFSAGKLLWPQATGHQSTYAVVNAPVLTIRAPMNGSVKIASPELARPVRRNSEIFELQASRASLAELARLAARLTTLTFQIAAFAEEERELDDVIRDLTVRITAVREIHIKFIEAEISRAVANRDVQATEAVRNQESKLRLNQLTDQGIVAELALRDAQLDGEAIEATMRAHTALIDTLDIERDAISGSLTSPQGVRRADYYIERIEEIRLRLADLRSRRSSSEGELIAIRQLHSVLAQEEDDLNHFSPIAAFDGVIWTASNEAGTDVNAGDDLVQLLDCHDRFLEASFSEGAFESLSPGRVANVRFKGSSNTIETIISSRHAVGGGTTSAMDGAITDRTKREGVTVFLKLDPADITDPQVASAFCDVGRTAEVHIPSERVDLGAIGLWLKAALGARGTSNPNSQQTDPTSLPLLSEAQASNHSPTTRKMP